MQLIENEQLSSRWNENYVFTDSSRGFNFSNYDSRVIDKSKQLSGSVLRQVKEIQIIFFFLLEVIYLIKLQKIWTWIKKKEVSSCYTDNVFVCWQQSRCKVQLHGESQWMKNVASPAGFALLALNSPKALGALKCASNAEENGWKAAVCVAPLWATSWVGFDILYSSRSVNTFYILMH